MLVGIMPRPCFMCVSVPQLHAIERRLVAIEKRLSKLEKQLGVGPGVRPCVHCKMRKARRKR
jgi:hypothetical protein